MLWLFDAVKGRFQHFEMLVDFSNESPEEVGTEFAVTSPATYALLSQLANGAHAGALFTHH